MGTGAAIISAVAATLAATLAAINLLVSGRREHTKWAREALVEVLVEFANASFDSKDAVKRAIREAVPEAWPPASDTIQRREAKTAEHRMRTMQTRLRLLAPPDVVDAAQRLRTEIWEYAKLLDGSLEVAQERELAFRRDIWHLRQEYLNHAKRALDLPRPWRRLPQTYPSEALGLSPVDRPSDQLGDNDQ